MRMQDFEKSTRMLSSWLNKKMTDSQLELMFDELQFIPGEAFEDICKTIMRSKAPNTAFPSVNELLGGWESWQKSHSDRVVKEVRTPCKACKGVGYWIVGYAKASHGGRYKGQVNCAECSNNPGGGIIRFRLDEIKRRGWTIDEDDQPLSPFGEDDKVRNVWPVVEKSFYEPEKHWEDV